MIGNQFLLTLAAKLMIDLFAGGGGASVGIEQAVGRHVDIAVNHNRHALAMHQVNHPQTRHLPTNVWDLDPMTVTAGQPVGLLWASPDCRHFSPAKGGAPVSDRVRSLAWVVIKWARDVGPDCILLENIPEFRNWGPVIAGRPCPERKGKTFRRWRIQLERLGYDVEFRDLRACDYGVPTIRKRLFMIAKKHGTGPIVWPVATHGPGLKPYRTAAECIDWSLVCPSIFERKKPLAEATERRLAHGLQRYVFEAAKPFIVPVRHQGDNRVHSIDEPLRTVTTSHRGELALAQPFIARIGQTGGQGKYINSLDEPLTTITTKAEHLLVAPTLATIGYGEREGQAPRVQDIEQPLGTVVGAKKHALVTAFLAKHFGGDPAVGKTCASLESPAPTVTARDHSSLVTSNLVKLRGTGTSQSTAAPLHTVSAGGQHHAEVRAFLSKYNGTEQDPRLDAPAPTATTKDRLALVTVKGERYVLEDIGMRMLQPRELFRAQGFADSYIIDRGIDPITGAHVKLTKEQQVFMCGNSVCPPLAAALVRANYSDIAMKQAA